MVDFSTMSMETLCVLAFGSPFDNDEEREDIKREYNQGGILAMFARLSGQGNSQPNI
jgi:hypothetical protein